ncbi:MAG TPA: hypothetical protein VKT77_23535 [Chthonomonadaceae bacterium]|nr:hypothetical protein [Chthonomonadaceae bacterium]
MNGLKTTGTLLVGGALAGLAYVGGPATQAAKGPAAPSTESQVTLASYAPGGQDQNGPGIADRRGGRRRPAEPARRVDPAYLEAIHRTADMAHSAEAERLAHEYGLDVLNLTWEDTGRYKDSSVGPNISDMTIQVAAPDAGDRFSRIYTMPVIRYPNFSDRSCDLDPRDFTILVGNEHGSSLRRISLYDFLQEPTAYLTNPGSWRSPRKTLLAPRDSKVLVSAQACFLPVPSQGLATFNPVLFNYQSVEGDPAVLTLLATREGSSVTVIDNKRDAFASGSIWGQRLFHNQDGRRASLTGQRMSDYVAGEEARGNSGAAKRKGLNMVLLVQIPLKQHEQPRRWQFPGGFGGGGATLAAPAAKAFRERSDVEAAVIGHGEEEGPFTEIGGLNIQRDDRYPIRVTVQFYKATSNGIVSAADMSEIKEQIDDVYSRSEYVGSLVTEGETGRVTEYAGAKVQPPNWWNEFWIRYERNTGVPRDVAIRRLRELLGQRYEVHPVTELYLRDLLRRHRGA